MIMKAKRKYFYLDDFEHRLLVGCLVTARNEYIREGKPLEDVNVKYELVGDYYLIASANGRRSARLSC